MKTLPTLSDDKSVFLDPKSFRAADKAKLFAAIGTLAQPQDRMEAAKHGGSAAAGPFHSATGLTPPKSHGSAAPSAGRVLKPKAQAKREVVATAAATAALPNSLWARVGNFLRSLL